MKKKFFIALAALLTLTCLFALASCGKKSSAPKKEGLEKEIAVVEQDLQLLNNKNVVVDLTK